MSLVLIAILIAQSVDYLFIGHSNWVRQERVYAKILGEKPQTSYGDYLSEYRAEMTVSLLADTYAAIRS